MPDYTDPHYLIGEAICVVIWLAGAALGVWTLF
jgi:hypothetical protein